VARKQMTHRRNADFKSLYSALPPNVRTSADKQYELLTQDPRHPSLHFKKVGNYWSVRVDRGHRALANEVDQGVFVWFWIGTHADYDRLIR
jgi:hypothetical protein